MDDLVDGLGSKFIKYKRLLGVYSCAQIHVLVDQVPGNLGHREYVPADPVLQECLEGAPEHEHREVIVFIVVVFKRVGQDIAERRLEPLRLGRLDAIPVEVDPADLVQQLVQIVLLGLVADRNDLGAGLLQELHVRTRDILLPVPLDLALDGLGHDGPHRGFNLLGAVASLETGLAEDWVAWPHDLYLFVLCCICLLGLVREGWVGVRLHSRLKDLVLCSHGLCVIKQLIFFDLVLFIAANLIDLFI